MYTAAVLIGRFQPVHTGHLALLQQALTLAEQVIVILGSAWQARTPKNPFTWQERADLLRAALGADAARVAMLPVRDYYDEPRWAQAVQQAVNAALPTATEAPRIALIGHFKDNSSSYLKAFPDWQLLPLPRQDDSDATPIRDAYFGANADTLDAVLSALTPPLHPSSGAWLRRFAHSADYAALQEEWQMLRAYRASWQAAPYPPIHVTVDALLRCQGQVLLIRRGHAPGKGLWALPGGFVEPQDTLWQSCLRELAEETGCTLTEEQLRAAYRQVRVFDHPGRSLRGRVITHVYHFDLGDDIPPPPVQGGDDAAHAQWVAQDQLSALEDQFHDDHWYILSQFLGLAE